MAKVKIKEEISTEEKIKQAARKLFTEKGFAAVKTREIAAEAGINLALLNYYFRGKENLYNIVMLENFQKFKESMLPVMTNENLSIDEIMTKATASYIDMLTSNPDLPYFILNAMKGDSPMGNNKVKEQMLEVRTGFFKRIEKAMKEDKIAPIHMAHYIMNFMGLVIFPFVAKPVLMKVNKFSEMEFATLMQERKRLAPMWLKAMSKVK